LIKKPGNLIFQALSSQLYIFLSTEECKWRYTDPDIIYPNGDQAQSIVIAYELQVIGGKLFCDQDETLELKYFSKEEKPQLFTGSHEELWNEIFNQN
jgi:hypothetical protein